MRKIARTFAVMFFACAGFAHALDAGLAAGDITPDVQKYKVPMAGYGARMGRNSSGVHDPLMAKVLYVRDGEKEFALITTDLRSVTPELKTKTIEKCADPALSADNVLLCASHNHSGPSLYPEAFWQAQFGKYDPAIVEEMSRQIAAALTEAKANAFPAKIGFAEKTIPGFTRNRRWGYDTEARLAAGETPQVDDTLRIVRVDNLQGEIKGLLLNFATHPTILGADNFALSAEWPGVLQRTVEENFPGAIALYANGAEGDQSPDGAKGEDAFAQTQDFGTRLAAEVKTLAENTETLPDLKIKHQLHTPQLPEISFSEGAQSGVYAFLAKKALDALPRQATLHVLAVGDIALVGLPGEAVCEVGAATRSTVCAAGYKHALILGLANDYIGYILNAREYAHGGYEVDARSFYGPLLGDFIATEAGRCASMSLAP